MIFKKHQLLITVLSAVVLLLLFVFPYTPAAGKLAVFLSARLLMAAGGDLSQHYMGWCVFRESAWYFPIGLMDGIVYPFKESIIYTDSIPLE